VFVNDQERRADCPISRRCSTSRARAGVSRSARRRWDGLPRKSATVTAHSRSSSSKDRVTGTQFSEPMSALMQLTVEPSHGAEIVILDERELTARPRSDRTRDR